MNWHDQVVLAPLTKGGNLPFRRLCADFGADITVSEMAYARFVTKGEGRELALLRRHPSEKSFGVQLAAKAIDEGTRAGMIAVERGAEFIDLNCGCPIHDTVRRGLGARLLRKPRALEKLVSGLVAALPVPVTVKIRLGWSEDELNASELATAVENAGAAALTVHGRTREQRYSRAANWQPIAEIAAKLKIPVIGNGDILTHYEAAHRKQQSGCAAVMIGRGALIKPWLFQEIREGRELDLTDEERVAIYFRLAQYMKEHFRDDEKGKGRAMMFLPWHFSFFHRYRPLPADRFEEASRTHPLIQTRDAESPQLTELGKVLSDSSPDTHQALALALWESVNPEEAVERLRNIASNDRSALDPVFVDDVVNG